MSKYNLEHKHIYGDKTDYLGHPLCKICGGCKDKLEGDKSLTREEVKGV